MDEIVKKLAGLGLPGVILVILTAAAGGSSAAVATILTALGGPFGILGGIALLALIAAVGDLIAGYGIDAILEAVYTERSKGESIKSLFGEINDLPISEELKLKIKNKVSLLKTASTFTEVYDSPKTVEIVDE